jgi:hypothetical protein
MMKKLLRAFSITPSQWIDLVRATVYLAIARVNSTKTAPAKLLSRGIKRSESAESLPKSAKTKNMVERVTWAVLVASKHVPWRSDCLIQAIAAQHWLSRKNIRTELIIGARNDLETPFEAHAWLLHDGKAVTGGDFSRYTPFVMPKS